VTPLHLARVIAALELEGRLPKPTLSLEAALATPERIQGISPATAHSLRSLLPQAAGQIVGFTGQATPQETGQRWLSWFVGLAPAEAEEIEVKAESELVLNPSQIASVTPTPPARVERLPARYAVVAVVVTGQADSEAALRIARAPLRVLIPQ
jgi:hypothetical protein